MKLKLLMISAALIGAMFTARAQCLSGGCDVGLSREQVKDGVFIGNFEQEKKVGLGITYTYNPNGIQSRYANYLMGRKDGVVYNQEVYDAGETIVHTFENNQNDVVIYPAFRITKKNKKISVEVAFDQKIGWKKYNGDQVNGNLQVKSIIHEGNPIFLAFNGKDQVMAVSATISSVEILSSELTEKYYNPLQVRVSDGRLLVNIYPKAGSSETSFRTNIGWDMENSEDGVWLYKRHFNNELSYKFTYEDVLELPSEQKIKQRKVQEAFDYIAEQVKAYDFEKGNETKSKDFINMLADTKARALNKGYTIPAIFDITMTELHLRNGDRVKSLQYAQSACGKSEKNYAIINDLITNKFTTYSDLLDEIKTEGDVATTNE